MRGMALEAAARCCDDGPIQLLSSVLGLEHAPTLERSEVAHGLLENLRADNRIERLNPPKASRYPLVRVLDVVLRVTGPRWRQRCGFLVALIGSHDGLN